MNYNKKYGVEGSNRHLTAVVTNVKHIILGINMTIDCDQNP